MLRTADITIFAVPSPVPILTGPAHPRVVALHASSVVLDLHRPGTYRLALTYTPYWSAPATCITETSDGMVELTTRRAGLVRLRFDLTFSGALAAFAGVDDLVPRGRTGRRRCRPADRTGRTSDQPAGLRVTATAASSRGPAITKGTSATRNAVFRSAVATEAVAFGARHSARAASAR